MKMLHFKWFTDAYAWIEDHRAGPCSVLVGRDGMRRTYVGNGAMIDPGMWEWWQGVDHA